MIPKERKRARRALLEGMGQAVKASQTFRENVKRLMMEQGIKVKDLSEMVGLSPSYLSLILSGERGNLSDEHKDALALALGTRVFELYLPSEKSVSAVKRSPPRKTISLVSALNRDMAPFHDFLSALNITDESLVSSFYKEASSLSDEEVQRFGAFLENVLSSWQEKIKERQDQKNRKMAQTSERTRLSLNSTGMDWETRRFGGVLASLGGVLGKVPLTLLEIASGMSPEEVLKHVARLEEAGFVSIFLESQGLFVQFLDGDLLAGCLQWTSPNQQKEVLERLRQDGGEMLDSFLTPLDKGKMCIEIGDLPRARIYYSEAVDRAFSEQNLRLARDLLLVILSIDRVLGTSPKEVSVVNQMMVTAYLNLNQLEMARVFQEKNLALWEKNGSLEDLVKGYTTMSAVVWRMGDWMSAKDYLEKALETVDKGSLNEARIRLSLWAIYKAKGYLSRGKSELERVLDISQKLDDSSLMAESLLGFGSMFMEKGDLNKAKTYLNRALALSEKKEAFLEASIRREMGRLLFFQENYVGAMSQFEMARGLVETKGDPETGKLIDAYSIWCKTRLTGQKKREGKETDRDFLPESIEDLAEYFLKLRHFEGAAISLIGQGEIMFLRGNLDKGQKAFQEGIEVTREASAPFLESLVCLSYSRCLEEIGDELSSVMKERANWARGKLR